MRSMPLLIAAALGLAASPGLAQSSIFSLTYTLADGNAHQLTDGTAITLPAVDVNSSSTATIDIVNLGAAQAVVSGVSVSGAGFRLNGAPALPAVVNAGQALRFGIVFTPAQPGAYTGAFRIDVPGGSVSGALAASTAAPNVALAYIDPDTNNTLPLRDGATLPFPNTVTGSSTTLTLVATNSGAGTGVVDSIGVSAAASPSPFQLVNLPVLPASVPPSQQLRFGVRFSPQQQQAFSGALAFSLNGHATTINLQAQGSASQFTYAYGDSATAATPGGAITVADTTVGQTTSIRVSLTNGGSADGVVSTLGVTGAGYSLSDLPPLPFTVRAGGSQSFTLNFAPAQPGAVNGRLAIGSDTFTVTAKGLGSRLIYTYASAAPAAPVVDGGTVILPPIQVGKNEKLQFTIQNTGTSAASILSINLTAPSPSFALEQLPAFPLNLDPDASVTFGVSFTPGSTGSLTATLRVNTSSFTLSGTGAAPPSLPSYGFQAPTTSSQPGQQPSIGLTLASPYPVDIDGALKLVFTSSVFTDDPAVQFATGGRTASFTIPANSTRALFNGNLSMPLQTGTTAGLIVITPSFTMRGGFDLTPPTPDALSIPIPKAAPQLLSASITAQTTNSFTVVLNGYSTTRSMRQLDVQLTPKAGESFSATHMTIDVAAASASWYQSAASQTAGGSFLAAIPFVLANGSSTDDLVHRLQSLSITATNDTGVSTAVTVAIP